MALQIDGCLGQQLEAKIDFDHTLISWSKDLKGQVYLGDENGGIFQFDPQGNEVSFFSTPNLAKTTNIDARNNLRIFTFQRDQQTVHFFNRFTTETNRIDLGTFNEGFLWLVSPATDNQLWALSTDHRELLKLDLLNKSVIYRLPLQTSVPIEDPVKMIALRNQLILLDRQSGLFFFDQFGNFLDQLDYKGIDLDIQRSILLLFNGTGIDLIDPFTQDLLETRKTPEGVFNAVISTDSTTILLADRSAFFYSVR